MVRLSTPLMILATVAAGFASPFAKRDGDDVVGRIDDITTQFCALEQYLNGLSCDSTAEDINVGCSSHSLSKPWLTF